MLSRQPKATASFIETFCEELLKEYRTPQLVWPETIAKTFSEYFCLTPPIGKEELLCLCEEIGLQYPSGISLPPGVRGVHIGFKKTFKIFYQEGEWEGGVRHTVLHEIWEIITHILDNYVLCNILSKKESESRANKFAAAVLMPRDGFFEDCVRMSFNPIMLREKYWQAYQSIVIRMRDVLGWETAFIGLMYENAMLIEYFKQRKKPLVGSTVRELNRSDNFRMSFSTFSYHFKSADEIAGLPRPGEWVKEGNFFHDITIRAIEESDILQYCREGMLFGCYPVVSRYETIEKVLVVGIYEDDWESLRRKLNRR